MVSHKEFETSGKKPGLEVWRVENMDLKPIAKGLHGSFYVGDAYLLLYTTQGISHNIHMWIGDECSQDESGTVAIMATHLDEHLGGGPRQFREVQNFESKTFLGYFRTGVVYKNGGMASGFNHVLTNDVNVKRLLHVKGRTSVRASEVKFDWTSFNKGDCFIIDLGKDIYVWCGSQCNRYERLKGTELAIDIRDSERNGRGKIHLIDEGEEPEAVLKVLGPKPEIAPCGSDDVDMDKKNKKKGSLYMISDASSSMKMTNVATSSPFKQSMLSPEECYILDNGVDGKIFVWKGGKANKDERKMAMTMALQFIKDKGYSPKTQIQVFPGGGETTLFKQFFFDWKDKDDTTGVTKPYTIGRIAKVPRIPFDASTLHTNKTMAAHHGMVDDGKGKVEIWRVEKGEKVPVDPSMYGHFYGGDCYLILYSYNLGGAKKYIIYMWQGLKSTQDEQGASAFLTVLMDDSLGGSPVQVRVTQGQEPPHLMSLFRGKPMIIHQGGTSKAGHSQTASTRLFHIRQSTSGTTRAVEVEASSSNLNSNDVFVLKVPSALFVWQGAGATDEELAASKHVAAFLGGTPTQVQEGKEPANFWSALGGKKDYQTSETLKKMVKPPRLFGCSNKTGNVKMEEVPGDFTQSDLATDDIMLLDTWDQIFLWVGKDANDEERKEAPKIAKDYVDTDPSGRRGLAITTIQQGQEPSTFIGWFQAWDPKMWDIDPLEKIQSRF